MAQRIEQMNAPKYAREAMSFSSMEQGLGAMTPPNQGMTNMLDGGMASKPGANAQLQRQGDLKLQNIQQNTISAVPQAVAAEQGMQTKMMAEASSAESSDIQYRDAFKANVMDAYQLTKGMENLNAEIDRIGPEQFEMNIAVSKRMGESPDLGSLIAEANQYG
jgi:hypothetical protein